MYLYDIIFLSNHRQFIVPTSILTSFFPMQTQFYCKSLYSYFLQKSNSLFFYTNLEFFDIFKNAIEWKRKMILTNYKFGRTSKDTFGFEFSYLRSLF